MIVKHITNKNRLKGSPNTILAVCKALRAELPPATINAHATAKPFKDKNKDRLKTTFTI